MSTSTYAHEREEATRLAAERQVRSNIIGPSDTLVDATRLEKATLPRALIEAWAQWAESRLS